MTSSREFLQAVSDRMVQEGREAAALLPTIIALACVDVLPIEGAGLSVMSDLRLPLASSDDEATFIERLQFTTGEGPCMRAAELDEALVTDEQSIAEVWPVFHAEMTARTRFRSTMSVPVTVDGYTGALNLYATDPSAKVFPRIEDVVDAVARPIRVLTSNAPTSRDRLGIEMPVWMINEPIDVRFDVWVATGRLMEYAGLASADALAVLRGHAFSRSLTLDEVCRSLVHGDHTPAEILDR